MQGRQGTKEEGEGGRRSGAKRRRKNFGLPSHNFRKLKGGRGLVGRWERSKNGTGREREDWVGSIHDGTEAGDAQVGE